jgi:hypothetical protein
MLEYSICSPVVPQVVGSYGIEERDVICIP